MSADASKEARKKQLEDKKRRLEEYKKKNQNSTNPSNDQPSSPTPASPARTAPSSTVPRAAAAAGPSSANLDIFIKNTLSSVLPDNTPARSAAAEEPADNIVDMMIQATSGTQGKAPRRKVTLSLCSNVNEVDIPPRETPMYSKGTQTIDEGSDEDDPSLHHASQRKHAQHNTHPNPSTKKDAPSDSSEPSGPSISDDVEEVPPPPPAELTTDERRRIMASTDFVDFFSRSSRYVERALSLAEEVDFMADYSKPLEDEGRAQSRTGDVRLAVSLFDERWSKHRSVTDLGWSPKRPDLLLTAYSASDAASAHDPDGVVLVWSVTSLYHAPEFVFHCQSPVMTASFSKFHSTLVVGGTYSGQIVVWDTRSKSTAVQRTPLSAVGHTHPIYTLSVVGTPNAHNLVSISTDGKMCVWSMDNLSQPIETLELANKPGKTATNTNVTAPVAVTSLAFGEGDVNTFLVGSEEGAIYQAYRHGAKSGIAERYEGHYGPITATDLHPSRGAIDFSHLFLSASTDWTVKLWSTRSSASAAPPMSPRGASLSQAIYSFEDSTDYVYDARWSPSHPAVFCAVDGAGYMDLWNLNEDLEAPIIKTKVGNKALNRLAWTQDAKQVVVGDSGGSVHVYNVGEVGVASSADEWHRLDSVLTQLEHTKGAGLGQGDQDMQDRGGDAITDL